MGGSWGLLRPSGSLLGRSWRPLGASWGALGGVLGPLGRLLKRLKGDQNITKITYPKKVNFQTPKRRIILRYGGGVGTPKSTQIGSKTTTNITRFSSAKKLFFKRLLEPAKARKCGVCACARAENTWALWSKMSATSSPKVPNMTPRWRPKTIPKSIQDGVQKMTKI